MRRTTVIASLAVLGLTAAACSSEDAAESFLENALEQEGGGDVDLDFGSDGGFSIETDEGSMSIDEDGNFVITDESGEVITGDVDVDGDGGVTIESDEGDFSLESDGDGGVTIESDEGNFSMESDGEGSTTFQSDEGEMTINAFEGLPDDWPGDVPPPVGLEIDSGSSAVTEESVNFAVLGMSPAGAEFAAAYGQQLVAAGFEEQVNLSAPGGVQASYMRGENETVSVIGTENSSDAPWDFIISYFRQNS